MKFFFTFQLSEDYYRHLHLVKTTNSKTDHLKRKDEKNLIENIPKWKK
jgi:hypothetical protein